MEHAYVDDLARSTATGGGTRRGVLRILAGGALGAVGARLGHGQSAAATRKRASAPVVVASGAGCKRACRHFESRNRDCQTDCAACLSSGGSFSTNSDDNSYSCYVV